MLSARSRVLVSCGDLPQGVKFGDLLQMMGPRGVAVAPVFPGTVKLGDPNRRLARYRT